ncbi:MAG: hypothetical protein AAFX90_10255 [Pseudomonadota bacterium]
MTNITREAVERPYIYYGKDGKPISARELEDQRDALLARVEELSAERDALSEYSFEATKAITELTAGGSEFFNGKLPDGRYKADLSRCVKYVRETKETLHAQVKRQYERGRLQGLDEAIEICVSERDRRGATKATDGLWTAKTRIEALKEASHD